MIKRTFGDVKEELRRVAGQTGLRAGDVRLAELVNLAQERLIAMGEWSFCYARLKLRQFGGMFALPAEYEAITRVAVSRESIPIRDAWFEFIDYGPGQQDKALGIDAAIDRGESPVIRAPLVGGALVRAYAAADERVDGIRPTIQIRGYDEKGAWVRSQVEGVWQDGLSLELRGDVTPNFDTSTIKFSRITQVTKPETKGAVDLNYVNIFGKEYLAGRYQHHETTPSFRIYFIPAIKEGDSRLVHVWARRRFASVVTDVDPLMVSSLPAMRLAVKAVALEDADRVADAAGVFELAAKVLRDEERLYKGTPNPPVEISPLMAFGDNSGIF